MKILLDSGWKLNGNKFENISANVPCTVLSTLLSNSLIPDPFVGCNEKEVKELLYSDYSFSKEFRLSSDDLSKTNYLVLEGIDTVADVYVNDSLVLSCNDMHIKYRVKLDNLLTFNTIKICFKSALNYIREYNRKWKFKSLGECLSDSPCLRKANYMFGWDWGPCLPDMGIYRPIYIESTNLGYLDSFRHFETFKDSKVNLDIETKFNVLKTGFEEVSILYDSKVVDSKVISISNESKLSFIINNPQLWYPAGYGHQNLYTVKIRYFDNHEELVYTYRIGLREIVIDDSKDKFGRAFQVYCNKLPIFIKGSDYIPQDNILPRVNKENTLRLLKLAKDFNQNTIRVWGGGYYLDDYFYDLCDELGLLVFQDLMFACAVYDMEDKSFISLIEKETKMVLERIRHHASIFIICGSNENELAIKEWIKGDTKKERKDFIKQYVDILKPIVKDNSSFYYLLSSPTSGDPIFDCPNDMNNLDMHYWDVWHGYKPFSDYKTIYPRLLSEFGCQSFPIFDTVLSYAKEDELELYSPVMMNHQKNRTCNDKILGYVNSLYKEAKDFKALVYMSMMSQAEGIKTCVEHIRRNRPRCQGIIYWQLNDCWPVQSWSSLDSFYNLKALHYYSGKFYNDYLISVTDNGSSIEVFINNDKGEDIEASCMLEVIGFDGEVKKHIDFNSHINKYSASLAFTFDDSFVSYDKELIYVSMSVADNVVSTNTFSRKALKDISFEIPNLTINKLEANKLMIETDRLANGVYLEAHDNALIFSDNYMTVIPNKPLIITSNKDINCDKLEITCLEKEMKI